MSQPGTKPRIKKKKVVKPGEGWAHLEKRGKGKEIAKKKRTNKKGEAR